MSRRDESLDDDCQYVLERVYVFLDHELVGTLLAAGAGGRSAPATVRGLQE
jgi:hypothetical protein